MPDKDPIPAADDKFDTLQKTIVDKTTLNAATWQITMTEITDLLPLQTIWNNTYPPTKDKKNTTSQQREAKNLARKNYEKKLRRFIKVWIYANEHMTDADIELCGLNPHDKIRTRVPVPASVPQVDTRPEPGHRMKIFFKQSPDENGISKRGKPKDVAEIEFVAKIGAPAPAGPDECNKTIREKRSPALAKFTTQEKGLTVYYFARWINNRGEGGGWTERGEFLIP
jgi:hypothetical protein